MSQLDHYLASLWPAPRVIGGAAMQPFALGHALLLHRLASPFSQETRSEAAPGLGDFILARAICRRTVAAAVAFVADPQIKSLLSKDREQWLRQPETEQIIAQLDFLNYLTEARQLPRWWNRSQKPGHSGTPFLVQLQMFVMTALHLRPEEAIETPLRLAGWWYCAHLEREGAIRLFTEDDTDALEASRKLSADLAAGRVPIPISLS